MKLVAYLQPISNNSFLSTKKTGANAAPGQMALNISIQNVIIDATLTQRRRMHQAILRCPGDKHSTHTHADCLINVTLKHGIPLLSSRFALNYGIILQCFA